MTGEGANAPIDRLIRRWCLIGAITGAVFAAYVSLVPFNFVLPADRDLIQAFSRRVEFAVSSRSNFLANILLFMPLGFLGAAATIGLRPGKVARLVLFVAGLGAAALLSFGIEVLQVLVPNRTPSWADITAQTIGAAAGMLAWLELRHEVAHWVRTWMAGHTRPIVQLALTMYAIGRAIAVLLPLDVTVDLALLAGKFRAGGVILDPRDSTALGLDQLPLSLSDLALAIPIGMFASLVGVREGGRRSPLLAIAIGVGLMAALEVAQILVVSRTADVGDFIINSLGVVAGVLIVRGAMPRLASSPRWTIAVWPLCGLLAALGLYVAYNWTPFDFVVSGDFVRERVPRLWLPPFYSYVINPEFKALDDLLLKMGLGAPVGMCLQALVVQAPRQFARTALVAAFALAATAFTVVELGQVLLPSRYPDNTDVLLALGGAAIGWHVARLLRRTLR